jgi:rRNA small subunit pseudouridine methyltransferase Nep1
MLNLVLAESAQELVPKSLWSHPSVSKRARRLKKNAGETLLDRSYHHSAMLSLENDLKRGRPDIVHFCLLNSLGTPLNWEGHLRTFVHTQEDRVIHIDPETRLPRNYDRFVGLMEQLYHLGRAPRAGKKLLEIRNERLSELVSSLGASRVVALSRGGTNSTIEKVVQLVVEEVNPIFLVGGFPTGRFTHGTLELADSVFSIDPETLDAWIVVSRIIYEYERAILLPAKRWSSS